MGFEGKALSLDGGALRVSYVHRGSLLGLDGKEHLQAVVLGGNGLNPPSQGV